MNNLRFFIIVSFTLFISHRCFSQSLQLDSLHGKSSVEYFGYPTPERTKDRLFFVQRNISKNVVVYDAQRDKSGDLKEKDPAHVYWKKYNHGQGGKEVDLKWFERKWGYRLKVYSSREGFSEASMVSYKKRRFQIVQNPNGTIEAIISINGRKARMHYIFMHMTENGFKPDIHYLEIGGEDLATGEIIFEQFLP